MLMFLELIVCAIFFPLAESTLHACSAQLYKMYFSCHSGLATL